ncbi:MAG: Hypothetical protein AJITA_00894 [Acetilactobacillus jinshanensis]
MIHRHHNVDRLTHHDQDVDHAIHERPKAGFQNHLGHPGFTLSRHRPTNQPIKPPNKSTINKKQTMIAIVLRLLDRI